MKNNKICFSKEKTLVIVGMVIVCALVIKVATVVNINQQNTSSRASGPTRCPILSLELCQDAIKTGDCEVNSCVACDQNARFACTSTNLTNDLAVGLMDSNGTPLSPDPIGKTDKELFQYRLSKNISYTVLADGRLDMKKTSYPNMAIVSQTIKCDTGAKPVMTLGLNSFVKSFTGTCVYSTTGIHTIEYSLIYRMKYGANHAMTDKTVVFVE